MEEFNWSPELAYLVGLIVTDGSLSKSGRHISFISKDLEMIENVKRILHSEHKVSRRGGGYKKGRLYYSLQFSNVRFYRWLESIGLTTNKTKTVGSLFVPDEYFADFLRGHLDGDGSTFSYWDPRWRSSFCFYTTFISASPMHILWLGLKIEELYRIRGNFSFASSTYRVRYAKINSLKLMQAIYYKPDLICLTRKRLKVEQVLQQINAAVEKQVDSQS